MVLFLLLPLCFWAWKKTRSATNLLLKAAHDILFAVNIGLSMNLLLYLVTFALRLLTVNFRLSYQRIELFFLNAYFKVEEIDNSHGFLFTVCTLIGLLLISRWWPRVHAIPLFSKLSTIVSITLIALLTITSFTFFSQVPLTKQAQHQLQPFLTDLNLLVQQDREQRAHELAAHELAAQATELDSSSRSYYQQLFTLIDKQAGKYADDVSRKEGTRDARVFATGNAHEYPHPNPPETIDLPTTRKEWAQLQQRHAALIAEVKASTKEQSEATDAAVKIISSALGALADPFKGLIREYVKAFIDQLSGFIVDKMKPLFNKYLRPTVKTGKSMSEYIQTAVENIRIKDRDGMLRHAGTNGQTGDNGDDGDDHDGEPRPKIDPKPPPPEIR